MKIMKRFIILALALTMALAAVLAPVSPAFAAQAKTAAQIAGGLTIAPGSDETRLNFSWYSPGRSDTLVIRESGASGARSFAAGGAKVSDALGYADKVTVTGLKSGSDYYYKLKTAAGDSPEYKVTTGLPKAFDFFVMGDAQIDSAKSARAWAKTLDTALSMFPHANFMVSLGDQSDVRNDEQLYADYLSPPALRSLPAAETVGNHDNGGAAYALRFNMPNVSDLGAGADPALSQGDYWFRYGKALFMDLNSNNIDISVHKRFMESAIKANTDCVWRIVICHHGPYSEGAHYNDSDQVGKGGRRLTWTPVFDELGIDAVFSGHDHCYTRTYQMLGNKPQKNLTIGKGAVVSPPGTLYITANSSSGSKYYGFGSKRRASFSAARSQNYRPQFINVYLTDQRLSLADFEIQPDGTVIAVDAYSIQKS